MVIYRNRWAENKLYGAKEKNTLYDIVYMYGAYIKYQQESNENAFTAYFNAVKDQDRPSCINAANAQAKKYFSNLNISSAKMRKLIITSNRKVAKSFNWMPEYVNFILSECMKINELKDYLFKYILKSCDRCMGKMDVDIYIYKCMRKILGFQYILLDNVGSLGTRKSESAKQCIERIKVNSWMKMLIEECPNTAL